MATVLQPTTSSAHHEELHSGDRMSREEFHRIYSRMPEDFKAELIGGVVFVSSALKQPHGRHHLLLGTLFGHYDGKTPGVEAGDNTTLLLADDSEPQPDLYLRILPEYGGQTKDTDDEYIAGAPELIAEVAHSSRAIDLHGKRKDYARYGVLEYLVLSIREQKLYWFDLQTDSVLHADDDGVLRLRALPGLWIHAQALLSHDYPRMIETLKAGMATPEHAEFVRQLGSRK